MNTLGVRLKALREEKGVSLSIVSKETGISVSNLSKYEKNTVKPATDAIISLSDYFNVSTDWILKGIKIEQQKNEVVFDPDLKMMIDILKELMLSDDPDLRGWAKVQFKNAFKEHCTTQETEKKLHA